MSICNFDHHYFIHSDINNVKKNKSLDKKLFKLYCLRTNRCPQTYHEIHNLGNNGKTAKIVSVVLKK